MVSFTAEVMKRVQALVHGQVQKREDEVDPPPYMYTETPRAT